MINATFPSFGTSCSDFKSRKSIHSQRVYLQSLNKNFSLQWNYCLFVRNDQCFNLVVMQGKNLSFQITQNVQCFFARSTSLKALKIFQSNLGIVHFSLFVHSSWYDGHDRIIHFKRECNQTFRGANYKQATTVKTFTFAISGTRNHDITTRKKRGIPKG
jgi:hypothetical protein